MSFGERLRQLRKEKNISQTELAGIFNITSQALSQYELQKRMPDAEMILKLADYFNVSVDYLLGRTDIRRADVVKDGLRDRTSDYRCLDTSGLCREDISKVEEYIQLLRQKYNPDGSLKK